MNRKKFVREIYFFFSLFLSIAVVIRGVCVDCFQLGCFGMKSISNALCLVELDILHSRSMQRVTHSFDTGSNVIAAARLILTRSAVFRQMDLAAQDSDRACEGFQHRGRWEGGEDAQTLA